MNTEFIVFPLAVLLGAVAGWFIRNAGYRSLKNMTNDLQGQLAAANERNEKLQTELLSSGSRVTELQKSLHDTRVTESDRNKNLEAEISRLTARLAETDALLHSGQPVVHALKLKLIEANNTIVRYKAKLTNAGLQF
jgi:predicted  nucleic acid-binding Zn-ribbon protein